MNKYRMLLITLILFNGILFFTAVGITLWLVNTSPVAKVFWQNNQIHLVFGWMTSILIPSIALGFYLGGKSA